MARRLKTVVTAGSIPAAGGILVTGFEPFGGEKVNPSWEICRALPSVIGRKQVHTLRVPTVFRAAIEKVAKAIERLEPSRVILLGQAGGRACISLERVAINCDDARIADNAGGQPIDEPVAPAGPAAYFASVPIKSMLVAIREVGVPAEVSNTAGTFVCNHLFYGVLHLLAARASPARAGFIHVPWLESQVLNHPGEPSMALATMVLGVEAAIRASLATGRDVKMTAGKLD